MTAVLGALGSCDKCGDNVAMIPDPGILLNVGIRPQEECRADPSERWWKVGGGEAQQLSESKHSMTHTPDRPRQQSL